MRTHFAAVARVTSLIAGLIAAIIALAVPTGYFLTARQYILGTMAAEAELTANSITGIVASNPKTWRFEEIRISEILHRRAKADVQETRRVIDSKGMVVAEAVEALPWPVITRQYAIYDAGVVVARVELSRSIQPLVNRANVIGILSLGLGGLIFIVLRLIPMRAVKTAYRDLSKSESRYRSLYSSMREGLGLFEPIRDPAGKIVDFRFLDVNPALEQILGRTKADLVDRSGQILLAGVLMEYLVDLDRVMSKNETFRLEATDGANGRHYDLFVFAPSTTTFATLIEDITDRKRSEAQIHRLAYYDPLTDLPNRFLLLDRLNQQLARASRDNSNLALLVLDLDRFKHINDTLGHGQGDKLLVEVAKRLAGGRRKSDTLARLGGDEFVVMVAFDGTEGGISRLAKKLVETLAEPFILAERPIFTGTSIGISIFPNDGTDADTLLKNADLAMYAAKEAGRNTYRYFTPEMNAKAHSRLEMEANIRQGLENNEFFLVFQPIIDITTNRVASAECLIRWRRADGTLVMPGDFIPIAEESGLILALGDWVLKEACRKLLAWTAAGVPLVKISVNVSARQFVQRNFLDILRAILTTSEIDTRYLELELTESSLMEDPRQVTSTLHQIKALGLSLAIDDFGTGYSSLAYLKQFPIDRLKIDRSFVRDVISDPHDRAIIEAIFVMADKLGHEVVVEGVETAEQVAFLKEQACSYIQGFYFHRPMEETPFLDLLQRPAAA